MTNEFLTLMLDPFANGRGNVGGGGGPTLGFASDPQASLPPDVALAHASILSKAPPTAIFDQRWSAWVRLTAERQRQRQCRRRLDNIAAGTFGFAAGMDYHISPHTVVGFALAGAGTSWGLRMDWARRQRRVSGRHVRHHLVRTSLFRRCAVIQQSLVHDRPLRFGRSAHRKLSRAELRCRAEGGYRFGVLPRLGVTPYGAVQAQDFQRQPTARPYHVRRRLRTSHTTL